VVWRRPGQVQQLETLPRHSHDHHRDVHTHCRRLRYRKRSRSLAAERTAAITTSSLGTVGTVGLPIGAAPAAGALRSSAAAVGEGIKHSTVMLGGLGRPPRTAASKRPRGRAYKLVSMSMVPRND